MNALLPLSFYRFTQYCVVVLSEAQMRRAIGAEIDDLPARIRLI